MSKTKLHKGDVIQWMQGKEKDGTPRPGVEILLEVERIDSEQEQVYLNIVERQFADLSKQTQTRKTVGKKTLSLEDALRRRDRHESINADRKHRRLTSPEEAFRFNVTSEADAEAASSHWNRIVKARKTQLQYDLKLAKKSRDDRGIIRALTELAKYQRLLPSDRKLLYAALQRDDIARIRTS